MAKNSWMHGSCLYQCTHSRMFSEMLNSSCAAFKQFLRYSTGSWRRHTWYKDMSQQGYVTIIVSMLGCFSQFAHCYNFQTITPWNKNHRYSLIKHYFLTLIFCFLHYLLTRITGNEKKNYLLKIGWLCEFLIIN